MTKHMIERSTDLGITAAVAQLLAEERAKAKVWHNPMPLVLALQFFHGDTKEAMALARLIADIEPERRDDVLFLFVRQVETPMTREIYEAEMYVGFKFPVMDYECPNKKKSATSISASYELWAQTVAMVSDSYYSGLLPHHSVFCFEADGCPMSRDWIDRLKVAHAETLAQGKRVTGPITRCPTLHINGSMVVHNSLWQDRQSLHRCPPTHAWDIFHAQTFVPEANLSSRIIENAYGMGGISESVFWTIGRESAWLTSIKDGLHQHWARTRLAAPISGRMCRADASGRTITE